jgi:hypothetical protein
MALATPYFVRFGQRPSPVMQHRLRLTT